MKDIKCPNCGMAFHIEESTYQTIVSQVRSHILEEEIGNRLATIREQLKAREEADRLKIEKEYEAGMAKKETYISRLQNDITQLKGIIEGYDARKEAEIQTLKANSSKEMADVTSGWEKRVAKLEQELASKDSRHKLKLLETENAGKSRLESKEREIIELKARLDNERLSAENREKDIRESHKLLLADKDQEIERLRNFRFHQSTKMVGESLEQHCSIIFSQAQSMGLYPVASFTKDTVAVEGTKGDFIFRDFIGTDEYISVMFEMKNETDTTSTKHRNEDFLEKLHKDRLKKGCEYAVLVSMLEQGNELYDTGIVDKSHLYPKMLVIRPQFFMPVLRLLTESSRKGFMEKRDLLLELRKAREESLDLSNFQDKLDKVRSTLSSNYETARKKFNEATDGIDKTIVALEKQIENLKKIKANFESSAQKFWKAAEIGESNLTIKRLTHGLPTIKKMIADAEKDAGNAKELQ